MGKIRENANRRAWKILTRKWKLHGFILRKVATWESTEVRRAYPLYLIPCWIIISHFCLKFILAKAIFALLKRFFSALVWKRTFQTDDLTASMRNSNRSWINQSQLLHGLVFSIVTSANKFEFWSCSYFIFLPIWYDKLEKWHLDYLLWLKLLRREEKRIFPPVSIQSMNHFYLNLMDECNLSSYWL